jgi:hypothetical protein
MDDKVIIMVFINNILFLYCPELMSRARSLEIYNLDLDGKKLLRSLTRTAAAEHNKECASGGRGHVTTGVPAGREFVGA